MTRRLTLQTGAALLALLCLSWTSLSAAEPISGTGRNPLTQIDLGNSLTFGIVAKPDTDKLRWELSEKRKDGTTKISSGYEIGANERFVYWWDADAQTMWIATSRAIEKTVLLDGLSKTTGGVYSMPGYERVPGMPEGFKKAVADLLNAK